MNDLHFVTDEFRRLASTTRDVADTVRQARPDGGASALASAMSSAELTSLMQGVEEECVDTCMVPGRNLNNHADSLDAVDRDFIATEGDNGQLISSIIRGLGFGGVSER